ncbi:MAG: AbrB/MazE/SpoVT family DNA-binding domain-containing protein [Patescibacteria group bacterium]|nr:AbrB/MazE/SpoVT family DNA-binding domain-containing protein [Patescibacteria group bacterium]
MNTFTNTIICETTMTSKGQIVIPKKIRDILKLKTSQKITLELLKDKQEVKLKSGPDILDLAGKYKFKKIIPATKLREKFEKEYAGRF